MSHFTVLVIGDTPEYQLAPFHEFECTGNDDEYVQDIDVTEKVKKDFESDTVTRLRDIEGNLHYPYSDDFYREPTEEEQASHRFSGMGWGGGLSWTSKDWGDGLGYRSKVRFVPEGWENVKVPLKETMSFTKYCEEWEDKPLITEGGLSWERAENGGKLSKPYKYGYTLKDKVSGEVLKVVDRTNPNKKWDWYTLGGRWTGFFKLKTMASGNLGSPGAFGNKSRDGYVDQCRKAAIDFDSMRNDAAEVAAKEYDLVSSHVDLSLPFESYSTILDHVNDRSIASEQYNAQEIVQSFRKAQEIKEFNDVTGFFCEIEQYKASREEFISNARASVCVPYALIKDGVWYSKGEMGWFGLSKEDITQTEWNQQFQKLIDELPEETLLSLYDCHI